MLKILNTLLILMLLCSCSSNEEIQLNGQHYREHKDYKSLVKVLELMPKTITTWQVKQLLGEPIDNGFDYRFLTDSISPNLCPVGAVFNIDSQGGITNRWVDEICE